MESGLRARDRGWRRQARRSRQPRGVGDLTVTRTADVVIVGGGVIGASIAFHLAGAGLRRVTVLERRFLASGGTGRSVGIIRQLYPTPETTRMVLRSLEVYRRFDEAVGGASGYVGCGALIGVGPSMRARLQSTLALQRSLG